MEIIETIPLAILSRLRRNYVRRSINETELTTMMKEMKETKEKTNTRNNRLPKLPRNKVNPSSAQTING